MTIEEKNVYMTWQIFNLEIKKQVKPVKANSYSMMQYEHCLCNTHN